MCLFNMINQMNVSRFSAETIQGEELQFSIFQNHLLLVVNTASKGQSKNELLQLQLIQNKFAQSNFTVLAFPCRQFLQQESKSKEKIYHRYIEKARLSFPVFTLTKVNGMNAHPFYKWLKQQASSSNSSNSIEWNFNKFLILPDGITVKRFSATVSWDKIIKIVEEVIQLK